MKKLIKTLLIISIISGIFTTAAVSIIEKAKDKEPQSTFEVTNILYESTNDFYLEPNEIGIEFNNGSWAVVNEQTNTYIFQAIELGDWEQQFESLQDFENCIKTYASIKNTGSY